MSGELKDGRGRSETTGTNQPRANPEKAAYAIGYGKPPEHARFKPRQSGNPKGARKKQKEQIDDVRLVVEKVLAEPVRLSDGKKTQTVSKLEAIIRTLRRSALTGNSKDAKALFSMAQKVGLFSQAQPESFMIIDPAGDAEQQMILRAFHAGQDTDQLTENAES